MRKFLKGILSCICLLLPLVIQAQNQTVRGKVTDVAGQPLPGASVVVQKGRQGTVTNAEGFFELSVPSGTKLTINFTGYRSRTLTADPAAPLQVVLEEDIAKLDEIIVTGLATSVKRRNAANSVATVSAKELSGTAPAQTLDAALSGKVTGANITASSGAPGGGLSFKLRGVSSIYGTIQPLFVIDGVIVSNRSVSTGLNTFTEASSGGSATSAQDNSASRIADINPADIENVEILKGASASAIYGSQASAGVVIITTKKGRAGKTRFQFNQDAGFASVSRLMGTKLELTGDDIDARGWSSADSLEYENARRAGKLYDYEKEMFGNKGFIRNTNLSVSGGNEKTTFHISAGTKKEEGIVRNTGYENHNIRLNLNHRASDRLKFGLSTAYMNTAADRGIFNNDNTGVSVTGALTALRPFYDLHPNADGVYPDPLGGNNVLETIALMTNSEKINRVITGANMEAILQQSNVSVTRFSGRAGVDFYHGKTQALFPGRLHFEQAAGTNGRNNQGSTYDLNTSWAAFLVNTLTPGAGRSSFTTTLGLTHEFGSFDQLMTIAQNLVGSQTSQGQASSLRAQQSRQSFRNDGIFFQEEFAYNEFLNLTAGVRFDKSTNNGDYKKYNIYPKVNASWNITRMADWNSSILGDLKLRVAYGESSGFPTFSSRFTTMPSENVEGIPGTGTGITLGNPDIGPERQTELEGGVDISFFNGRLSLEATVYNKVIKDLLVAADWPISTGFSSKWINGGSLRNRGLELSLRTVPVNNRNIRWNSNVNFWLNRSKVLTLDVPMFDMGDGFGSSYGAFYIEQGRSATQILIEHEPGVLMPIGNSEPDFQLNWFNEVTLFRDFTFRALLHYKKGGDNINLTQLLRDWGGVSRDWDNRDDKGERTGVSRADDHRTLIQDASYLRLREVALFYRLPIKSKTIENIQVGVSANNYFISTNYDGYDPEVSNFGSTFGTGVDVNPYPASKRLQFHLSLNF
ncbi:SusC/RagA family TonB-linked outer membrane protein [Chitinophaga barathri]|uniref:SusC/RagA family TonB-linked outer membrane protein n=1 Tax=Chitinophaga barathri TaxID=1647451 RepID=A0A3N4MSD1_9BACT|nr:SusC/RagA family TonB-linked outer membrane protein [Chitinophaga barathri]RPD42449.1 SusC/RagA family TonB-linked outer membrane protein [Chitinophaga barathri]